MRSSFSLFLIYFFLKKGKNNNSYAKTQEALKDKILVLMLPKKFEIT